MNRIFKFFFLLFFFQSVSFQLAGKEILVEKEFHWEVEGDFCINGIWDGVKEYAERLNAAGLPFYGSYCNGDQSTGSIESLPFICPDKIKLHLIGSFSRNSINLYILNTENKKKYYLTNKDYTEWTQEVWEIPSDFIGKKTSIIVTDRDTSWGGWVAISNPLVITANNEALVLSPSVTLNIEDKELLNSNTTWSVKGEISNECLFEGAKTFSNYLLKYKGLSTIGTFCNGDASIGEAISPIFTCPDYLKLYLIGTFSKKGLNIYLEKVSTREKYNLTNLNFSTWSSKTWKVPDWLKNEKVYLILEDKESSFGGWGAVSYPLIGEGMEISIKEEIINLIENNFFTLKMTSIILFLLLMITVLWQHIFIIYRPKFVKILEKESVFLILLVGLIFICRLPYLFLNIELNPDESLMVAQSMKLSIDPIFWRDVDGVTGGPLLSYILLISKLFLGDLIDYSNARITGLVLISLSTICSYFAIKNFISKEAARVAILVMATFYAFATEADYIHYSSEHVSIAVISILLLIVSQITSYKKTNLLLFGTGFLIGLTPFTKLQCLPIIFVIGLLFLVKIYKDRGKLASFVGGGITCLILFLLYLHYYELYENFYYTYIKVNFLNDSKIAYNIRFENWRKYLFNTNLNFFDFKPIFYTALIFMLFNALGTLFKISKIKDISSKTLFIFFLVIASFFSILRTGRNYPHYLHFAVIPLVFYIAYVISKYFVNGNEEVNKSSRIMKILSLSIIVLLTFVDFAAYHFISNSFKKETYNLSQNYYSVTEESDYIASLLSEYEKITIWGWEPKIFIKSRTIQATRDAIPYYAIGTLSFKVSSSVQEYYRNRFMSDLDGVKPELFIDATGPNNFSYRENYWNHDRSFPKLGTYIKRNYNFIGKIGNARMYKLKAD